MHQIKDETALYTQKYYINKHNLDFMTLPVTWKINDNKQHISSDGFVKKIINKKWKTSNTHNWTWKPLT